MRSILCLLLCLTLSACLTNGKRGNDTALAIYDLGIPDTKTGFSSTLTATVIEVRAPLWLDTMGIDYRLGYVDSARLLEYSQARWAGPPTQLIQQRLAQQLGMLPVGQGRTNCILRLDISEFSQYFDTPQSSRGLLFGHVQLLDKNRSRIVEREVVIEKVSPSPDSRGGVTALTAAVEQLASDLANPEKFFSEAQKISHCKI